MRGSCQCRGQLKSTRLSGTLVVVGGQRLISGGCSGCVRGCCFALFRQGFKRLLNAKLSNCDLEILVIMRSKASLIKNYDFLCYYHHYCYFVQARTEFKRSSYLFWEV